MNDTIPWILPTSLTTLLRLAKEGGDGDCLTWTVDKDTTVRFFFDVYGLFSPSAEDHVEIKKEDLKLLEDSYAELKAMEGVVPTAQTFLIDLFACRKRGMRPTGQFYFNIPKPIEELFDACGPEREDSPKVNNPAAINVVGPVLNETIVFDETGAISEEDVQKLLKAIFSENAEGAL